MFENFKGKYRKALVIGTGGGNDIVSTLIPALYLKEQGIRTDIAGILSPAAIHRFGEENALERVVNRVDSNVERIITSKNPFPIKFIDGILSLILPDFGIKSQVYDFSIRYGTENLVNEVNKFIAKNHYDLVVGTDVGGDILARGRVDDTLLSPIMDFTSLYLLGKINVDSALVEFGLGTDGELRPDGMDAIIDELYKKNLLLNVNLLPNVNGSSDTNNYSYVMSIDDKAVKKFSEIFNKIKWVREGHTAVMTLQTLEILKDGTRGIMFGDMPTEYKFKSQVGDKKIYTTLDITLPAKYFGKMFVIDAKRFAAERQNTAFSYHNPLEQYIRLKGYQPNWKNELDTQFLWSGDISTFFPRVYPFAMKWPDCESHKWNSYKKDGKYMKYYKDHIVSGEHNEYCMQLLALSTQIKPEDRKLLIEEGLSRLNNDSDIVLAFSDDIRNFFSKEYLKKNKLDISEAGHFSLVTKKLDEEAYENIKAAFVHWLIPDLHDYYYMVKHN